jgi:hypothetical protein
MKRIALLVVLALALPLAAFANSQTDFVDIGQGTLSGLTGITGLSMSGAITDVFGLNGGGLLQGGSLGLLSISTGGLLSKMGNIEMFSGGTLTITGSGGALASGTLFSGTFSGPVELINMGKWGYDLACEVLSGCTVTGAWANGHSATGGFNLLVSSSGVVELAYVGLQTQTSVTPEPSTLGLLGTGLLGLGAVVRRKVKA